MAVILCSSIVLCLTPLIIVAVQPDSNSTSVGLNVTSSTRASVPQESSSTSMDLDVTPSASTMDLNVTPSASTMDLNVTLSASTMGLNVTLSASTLRQTTWTSPTSTTLSSQTHISTTELSQITSSPAVTTESGAGYDAGLTNKVTTNSSLGKPSEIPRTETTDNGLTMLAFGVMSFILILIIIMVILVTVVNFRDRCFKSKEEGGKSYSSVVSDSNLTSNEEKESITLISVRTINTDNDSDSLQISSVQSTVLDSEDQELSKDMFTIRQ